MILWLEDELEKLDEEVMVDLALWKHCSVVQQEFEEGLAMVDALHHYLKLNEEKIVGNSGFGEVSLDFVQLPNSNEAIKSEICSPNHFGLVSLVKKNLKAHQVIVENSLEEEKALVGISQCHQSHSEQNQHGPHEVFEIVPSSEVLKQVFD